MTGGLDVVTLLVAVHLPKSSIRLPPIVPSRINKSDPFLSVRELRVAQARGRSERVLYDYCSPDSWLAASAQEAGQLISHTSICARSTLDSICALSCNGAVVCIGWSRGGGLTSCSSDCLTFKAGQSSERRNVLMIEHMCFDRLVCEVILLNSIGDGTQTVPIVKRRLSHKCRDIVPPG